MKIMKKRLFALMLAVMMLAITACGNDDGKFTIGTTTDTYYENEYFGICYTPTNDMVLQNEDYIKQVNAALVSILDDSSVKKSLESGNSVTLAYALNADSTQTFNIIVQNVKSVFQKSVSDEDIIEQSLDTTKEMLESMGIFDSVKVTKGTAKLLGKEVVSMDVAAKVSGYDFYETEVLLRKGNYVMFITAGAYFDKDTLQTILDDIKSID